MHLHRLNGIGKAGHDAIHPMEILGERKRFGAIAIFKCSNRIDAIHASDTVLCEFAHFLGDRQFFDATRPSTSLQTLISYQLCE